MYKYYLQKFDVEKTWPFYTRPICLFGYLTVMIDFATSGVDFFWAVQVYTVYTILYNAILWVDFFWVVQAYTVQKIL